MLYVALIMWGCIARNADEQTTKREISGYYFAYMKHRVNFIAMVVCEEIKPKFKMEEEKEEEEEKTEDKAANNEEIEAEKEDSKEKHDDDNSTTATTPQGAAHGAQV